MYQRTKHSSAIQAKAMPPALYGSRSSESAVSRILGLQRSLGNRATLQLLAGKSSEQQKYGGAHRPAVAQGAFRYISNLEAMQEETIDSWSSLVHAIPELASFKPLSEELFDQKISLQALGAKRFNMSIIMPDSVWSYNSIPASFIHDRLQRYWDESRSGKAEIRLLSGKVKCDMEGVGLEVEHQPFTDTGLPVIGTYKVRESLSYSSGGATTTGSGVFNDFHYIPHPHRRELKPGQTVVEQNWNDSDGGGELIPYSGFKIERNIVQLDENTFQATIKKTPSDALSAKAGGGKAVEVTFIFYKDGDYFKLKQ